MEKNIDDILTETEEYAKAHSERMTHEEVFEKLREIVNKNQK